MRSIINVLKAGCAAATVGLLLMTSAQADDRLSATASNGARVHLYPTYQIDKQMKSEPGRRTLSNVTYHTGGRIMRSVQIFAIFWNPAHLQDGSPSSISAGYQKVLLNMMKNYAGHGVSNTNSQYFEIVGGKKFFHTAQGSFGGVDVATNPFPARTCNDTATPGNCLTDAQLQHEISLRMAANGWVRGLDRIYVIFTPKGMGSCFNAGSCAYTAYCAYHGFFGSAANPAIYANEPYGTAPGGACQLPAITTPNVPTEADSAATAARHEISEATSDPELNAWFDPVSGEETSDKCNFTYGPKTYAAGKANYNWGGFNFLLQQEYSNHVSNCVTDGPSGI